MAPAAAIFRALVAATVASLTMGCFAQALEPLAQTATEILPPDMSYDWADMSYQESKAPGVAEVFALAILLVFLILVAQFESWGLPFSVLLGTPFAAFGAYLGLWLSRTLMSQSYVNNVFAQIALIMLIGPFAFILGVVPLLAASGAGAEARKVMGMAVAGPATLTPQPGLGAH